MKKIKIVDNLFSHAEYSTDFQKSKYIIWDRKIEKNNELVIFTDTSLEQVLNINSKKKIAWLIESPEITRVNYNWIKINYDKFDKILTFDKELLSLSDKFEILPIGGCWINPEEQNIYSKTKNISIIASNKNTTKGHNLRHKIIFEYRGSNLIDVYGRVYKPIYNKLEALKDYRYSICIENTKSDYYFTEKLIDCFRTGTIPIYYGCPSISNFFDINGMIIIDSLNDLKNIILTLNDEIYNNKKESILRNFEIAKEFLIAEDNLNEML